MDLAWVETNPFFGFVVVEILESFVYIVPSPFGPCTSFLFQFEECVYVVFEHVFVFGGKMPYFVDVLDDVPLANGFFEFGGAPRANQAPFLHCVIA